MDNNENIANNRFAFGSREFGHFNIIEAEAWLDVVEDEPKRVTMGFRLRDAASTNWTIEFEPNELYGHTLTVRTKGTAEVATISEALAWIGRWIKRTAKATGRLDGCYIHADKSRQRMPVDTDEGGDHA